MEEIGNPRNMNLYKRSLLYSKLVLDWTMDNREEIGEKEFMRIRKMAVGIPKNIAKAIVDINIKDKYKKLNQAKDTFLKLTDKLQELGMDGSENGLDGLSLELLKLFNGYFGYLAQKKKINSR